MHRFVRFSHPAIHPHTCRHMCKHCAGQMKKKQSVSHSVASIKSRYRIHLRIIFHQNWVGSLCFRTRTCTQTVYMHGDHLNIERELTTYSPQSAGETKSREFGLKFKHCTYKHILHIPKTAAWFTQQQLSAYIKCRGCVSVRLVEISRF